MTDEVTLSFALLRTMAGFWSIGNRLARLERPAIASAVLGFVLLDLAALDDITTGVQPHFYYEYAMLAVSVPLLGWLVRRFVSATRRRQQ